MIEHKTVGVPDIGGKLVTLNPQWLSEGRLFSVDYGTSFSAAKVSHCLAMLLNEYGDYSNNLLKALLISSARIPRERPDPLSEISLGSSDAELGRLLSVYGYGKPSLQRAISSGAQRVLLISDRAMRLDSVDVYHVLLPKEFIHSRGTRTLSVTLAYDPLVNKNRVDYMGCAMEFHLFKNMEPDEVVAAYRAIERDGEDQESVPEGLQLKEIVLRPGVNLRKRGMHQKGVIEYNARPGIDHTKPIVLVVICRNRWIRDQDYLQDYAVVLSVQHSARMDLFNLTRVRNEERLRIAARGA